MIKILIISIKQYFISNVSYDSHKKYEEDLDKENEDWDFIKLIILDMNTKYNIIIDIRNQTKDSQMLHN